MASKLLEKTSELSITVETTAEEWKKAQVKAEGNLAKNVVVKGFRKGQVPPAIAKKHISKADIYTEGIKLSVSELGKKASKEVKKDVMLLGQASYLVKDVNDKKLVLEFIYPVFPKIDLPDLKSLGIKLEVKKVEAKVIDEELKRIQATQAMLVEKDGAIAKGDVAIFDFKGLLNGKAFEGGTAKDFQLEIGSGRFIPGFEDKMIGLKKGDKKDLDLKFPENYPAENLKGKDVVFKVEIKQIKTKDLPKLDDELAKSVGVKEVTTLEQLKKYVKGIFEKQYDQEARAKFQRAAFDKILKTAKFGIPNSILMSEMQGAVRNLEQDWKSKGINKDQYLQMTGMTEEKLNEEIKKQADFRLRDAFIFAEIVKIEKLEMNDKDYEEHYKLLAKAYNQPVENIKNVVTKQQVQMQVLNDKALSRLIELNK